MTEDQAAALLAAALHEICPEADLGAADPGLPLQEIAEIDSMDFLRLVTIIRARTGIEIPPRDYPKLATVQLFVSYLTAASGGG